ncbi:MAG: choice-of-anchor G family protein [Actinomycetota bacterium]|nr:choice-of-anchor G family protein [Actinomycetota bacterium]
MGRIIAVTLVGAITAAGLAITDGQGASAASLPNAQSVGRFLDGAVGGNPIQGLADLKDARATAPGTQSQQNPLDLTLLNALDIPLGHALQLPPLGGIVLGAANQVAVAHLDGYSYGASGAVANSGAVSIGGNNNAFPADASIDLNLGQAVSSLVDLKLGVGAVAALAQTPVGFGKPGTTNYEIAGLALQLTSPLLKTLLTTVTTVTNTLFGQLPGLPAQCATAPNLGKLQILGNSITLNGNTGALTIDLSALLSSLKLNLNNLPPNTDLIKYLIDYISTPALLATGLANTITSTVTGLTSGLATCLSDLPALQTLLTTLTTGLNSVLNPVTTLVGTLKAGGVLSPLATALKNVLDVGINVQPNGAAGTFTSKLKATPDQATPVVAGQTIVRAIEINLLGQTATVALANAAAGPSTGTPPATTTPTTTNTNIPTGVPAGQASPGGGSGQLPLILLLAGLLLSSGGAVAALKLRGRHSA